MCLVGQQMAVLEKINSSAESKIFHLGCRVVRYRSSYEDALEDPVYNVGHSRRPNGREHFKVCTYYLL